MARVLSTTAVLVVGVLARAHLPVIAQEPQPRQGQEASAQEPAQPGVRDLPVTPPQRVPIVDPNVWIDSRPPSLLDRWLSSSEFNCVGCGGDDVGPLPTPTNANAPWAFQGALRRDTAVGVFSAGFLGVRNYAAPLYTAMPIGGTFSPGGTSSSPANLFVPSTQWHMTATFRRTLLTTKRGATMGVAGDVLLPISTDSPFGDTPRIDQVPSRAVRAGITFRW